MKSLPPTLKGRFSYPVSRDDTAAAIGNPGVEAVSTVTLIKLIETACFELVRPYYDGGDATVGTRVCVDHVAMARPGTPVDVVVERVVQARKRLRFDVTVEQGGVIVMRGEHDRYVVDVARFGGDGAEPTGPLLSMDFWFDFHSPWSYIASHRIGAIARRHGVQLNWRPVHLANLADRIDGRRPLEANPAFVKWYRQDIEDMVALHGLPYREHPDYPLRPSRALRAALAVADAGLAELFVMTVMRGYWSEASDISDIEYLRSAAVTCGLDPDAIAEATGDPVYKTALTANLDEAVATGIFGLPTVVFAGKIFFGNDHLDLLERHLAAACVE